MSSPVYSGFEVTALRIRCIPIFLLTFPTASSLVMRMKRSFMRSFAAPPLFRTPSTVGPGNAAETISDPNLANSDPGKNDSAVNAPTDAPPPAIASKRGVIIFLLLARSRIPPTPLSKAPKRRTLLGPKEGSNPSFPKAKGLP